MNLEKLMKTTINELLIVLSMLIYRKQIGIKMTPDEKIHFLTVLFKKCEEVYIHYHIDCNIEHVEMLRLPHMIDRP